MKLFVVMFKDLRIRAFTNPQFIDIDPEKAAEQLERSLIMNINEPEKIKPYKDLDMYFIGEFDDNTGKFTQVDPVLLLSCRDVIEAHIQVVVPEKEVQKDA